MYLLLFILALGVLIYFLNKVNDPTVFNFNETSLSLYDKKPLLIDFDKIKRIDRGIADSEYGGILHVQYHITFENLNGSEEVISFKRSTREFAK